jgi:fibronectin-binding autotransporter adhesin
MKSRQNRFVISFAIAFSMVHAATGAVLEWNGSNTGLATGTNNTWDANTTSNWWNGASNVVWPAAGGTDDDATFGGTAGNVSIATGGITANDVSFNTTGYTISGAALTLNGTTPTVSAGSGVSSTISAVIAGTSGLTKTGNGTLILSGANTHTGTTIVSAGILRAGNAAALGSNTVKTTIASGAVLDGNGQNLGAEVVEVSGSGIGSTGAITNTGADQINAFRFVTLLGHTTFGGPNRWDIRKATTSTFDMGGFDLTKTGANYLGLVDTTINNPGNVTINQGTLNFTFVSTIGTTAAKTITVNSGGTLGLFQSSPLHGSNLVLNTGSIFRGENGSGAQNTWAGPVSATGEVTLQTDGVLTVNSNITGIANLTKTGNSTLTVAATGGISTTGNLAVNAGTLTVNGSLAHNGTLAVSNATLNINGTSPIAGTTTLTNATLNLSYATDDNSKLHDSSALILAGATVGLAGGTHSEVVASTTLSNGSANAINLSSGAAFLNLNSISLSGGATLNIGAGNIASTDNTNTHGILGPWATVGGNQWAVNSSGGADGPVIALTDFVNALTLANDNALYQGKHVVVDSVQAPDAPINPLSLVFNTAFANSLTFQGTNTLATGGILVGSNVGNNTSTLTGGSITGPNNGDLTIHQRNTANSILIASSIVDNGTTSVVKSGLGTLVLSGSNSYSGSTQIAAGSLQISAASAIGGSQVSTSGLGNSALVLGDGIVVPSSKSLTIAGSGAGGFYGALSTATGSTGTSEWQGTVTIGALTGTRIGTLGGTLLISGNIGESAAGSQLLVRNNETVNGTTILGGNNTFSGGLQLIVGNLRMAGANALGTGTLSLGSGTNANSFSSDGPTARTITVPTALIGTGTINLGDATLNGKLTFSNTVDLAATARTVSTASEVEFSGNLTGSGAFTKTGASNLTLSSANSFSGAVTINGGKLICTHNNALGTSEKGVNSNPGGTVELASDTAFPNYAWNTGSGGTGTIILNRATPGTALTQNMTSYFLGNSNVNFEAGPNVTSGIPTVNMGNVTYSAGAAGIGYTKLNPVGVNLIISSFTRSGANAPSLRLGGTSTGNFISGTVSNGSAAYTIAKEDSGTWELSGVNTYIGATTVTNGKLILSGNRTASVGGTITVGNTAGQTATLDIKGDLPMAGQEFGIGATAATATGIVNHSAGLVSFTANNQLLIGRSVGNVSGSYNLSGGELKTAASPSRGVMLGVNDGTAGNLINANFNLSGTGNLNNATGALQVVRGDNTSSYHNSTYNQTGGTSTNGFLIIGGGIDGANNLNAARGANSIATLSVTGGTFSANVFNGLSRANNTHSTLTIGGTAEVTLPAFPTARGTSSTATLYFDGGVLKPSATSAAYLGGLSNAFIKSGGAKFNTNSFDITVSQALLTDPVSTSGGLTKEGTGSLALTGSNTYTGDTTVTAGTLSLGNGTVNTNLADVADVGVASGATLNLNYSGTDTIDGLSINGVAKASGIWGSASSGAPNTDPQLTGSGTLTVTTGPSASAYDTWASGFSLTGPNAAFDFDFDNDGIENGLEWILGGNPTTNSAGILPVATKNVSGDLILTFNREEDSITESTLKVQFGSDLASWPKEVTIGGTSSGPDVNGVTVAIDTAASPDAVTVTIPASNAPAGSIFARLNATRP